MRVSSSELSAQDASFIPDPGSSLYSMQSLLGAWTDADVLSYAETLDARTFLAAKAEGLRTPAHDSIAKLRALHDVSITRALAAQLVGTRPVAIMGGHDLSRDDPVYRQVAECAAELTRRGFTVLTGGGPGAMEAAHLGASFSDLGTDGVPDALRQICSDKAALAFPKLSDTPLVEDGSFNPSALAALHAWQKPAFALARSRSTVPVSIGISTWLYGHEPPTPLAPIHAKYFENSVREDGLLAVAIYGVLYAPGRAGTLQEVFQDAAQNYYRTVGGFSPMVFLDIDEYWSRTFDVKSVLEALFVDVDERFLHYATGVDEAVSYVDEHVRDVQRWAPKVKFGSS